MTIKNYIGGLSLSDELAPVGRIVARGADGKHLTAQGLPENLRAAVDVGSLLSFVAGVDANDRSDVLFSVQLAQRAADAAFDRFAETKPWYGKYNEVLEAVGWTTEQFAFAAHKQGEGEFKMNDAALGVITAIATGGQLLVIKAAISALGKLADKDGAITIFDYHAARDGAGNFQLGAVEKSPDGVLSMAAGSFYFRSTEQRRKFLFFSWGRNQVNFWAAAQKMTFNTLIYAKLRDMVAKKLGDQALSFVANLDID